MTLAKLLEVCLKILAIVGGLDTIRSLLITVGIAVENAAKEESPYLISGTLSTLDKYVRTTGADNLHVLHDGLDAIKADTEAIIAALDGLGTGGGLTTEEHDHLIALENTDVSGVPDGVWAYPVAVRWADQSANGSLDAITVLQYMSQLMADQSSYIGLPHPSNPWVLWANNDPWQYALDAGYIRSPNIAPPPIPDFSLVQAGDTVLSFLQRTQPTRGWTDIPSSYGHGQGWPGQIWCQLIPGADNTRYWRTRITQADIDKALDTSAIMAKLDLIQPDEDTSLTSLNVNEAAIGLDVGSVLSLVGILMGGEAELTIQMVLDAIAALAAAEGSQIVVPPVWPGLDNVTLGTPVGFDGNVDVTADMDGVLVTLTTSPTKTGHYMLGNVDLWYGLGRISFESDNGDVEPWQYLAFDYGIFVPRTMQHASAVHLQVLGGAEGTVTPWTITPPSPAPAVATAEYDYPTDDDDPAGV